MTLVTTEKILEGQIMDELMDAGDTTKNIARELGAHPETVRRAIRALEARGLIYADRSIQRGQSPPEIVYEMARTQRSGQ